MTQQEMIDFLRDSPVPYRMAPNGLQVMDMTMLSMGHRALFDAQGMFVGGDAPESVTAEPSAPDTQVNAEETAEEDEAQTLRGKLPEDFPGYTALVAAGIDTYGKLRKAGDVTEIEGIGPATAEKIHAALGESE